MDPEERRRLQAIAYGPGSDPAAAADAARALAAARPVASAGSDASRPDPEPRATAGAGAPVGRSDATARGPDATAREPEATVGPVPALPTDDAASAPDASAGSADTVGRHGARPPRRLRPAVVLGIAVLAFGLGSAATVGLSHLPTASGTSGARSSTSEQTMLAPVLAHRQSAADRLPAALRTGLVASSSRLVFSNSAAVPRTPWSAWVASTPGGELCVVASPDGRDATRSCMTHVVAFDGTSTLVASADGDTLTAIVAGGIVDVQLVGRG